jgi:hypothetical protein
MSDASCTPTVTRQYVAGRVRHLLGTLAIDAAPDTYATGGLALSLEGKHPAYKKDPIEIKVFDIAGYRYEYNPVTKKVLIFAGVSSTAATLIAYSQPNVKGAGAAVSGSDTTDQSAGPVNDDYISNFSAIAAGAYTYAETLEIDVPRNVIITYKNASGGPLNLYEGANTITVTGTFRGAAQTETITWTSTSGNKAIADTKFRWKAGVKPFDTITSVTMNHPGDNVLQVGIGLGRLLGYPTDGNAGTSADFIKATVAGADAAFAAVETTNKTVDLGALSDGNAVSIEYNIKTPGATSTGELSASAIPAAISGGTIRFHAIIDKF